MGGPDTGEKHYCADHKRLPGGSEMSGNLRKVFLLFLTNLNGTLFQGQHPTIKLQGTVIYAQKRSTE